MLDKNKIKLILDTDIEAAYDDIGAIAVMHALCAKGEVEILAVICDSLDSNGGPCIDVINSFYERNDIPIGVVKISDYESNPRYDYYREYMSRFPKEKRYNEYIKQNTRFEKVTNEQYLNAVEVYRKSLCSQPDSSVVICAIGYLTAIEGLLKSEGDMYSELDGYNLVKRKVKKIVTMSDIPFLGEGRGSFNWDMDFEAAKYVINHSPCPIYISGYGKSILTGKRLSFQSTGDGPVCKAYKKYLVKYNKEVSSWDQVAMLYAVKGEGDIFTERRGYILHFDDNKNMFIWNECEGERSDVFIDVNICDSKLSKIIEELMMYEPRVLMKNK